MHAVSAEHSDGVYERQILWPRAELIFLNLIDPDKINVFSELHIFPQSFKLMSFFFLFFFLHYVVCKVQLSYIYNCGHPALTHTIFLHFYTVRRALNCPDPD